MSAPATRPCVGCSVVILAAASRCTLCGAEQPRRRRLLSGLGRILPPLIGAALASGLVVAGVITSGSGASTDFSHRLFQVRRDMNFVELVPQNWQGGHVAAPPHVVREVFFDPDRDAYSMTIELRRHARGSALARARALAGALQRTPGFVQGTFQRARFPGGRPTWLFEYQLAGVPHATYIFSACSPTEAMSVDISAPTRAELAGPLSQLPAFTGPRC